MQRNVMACLFSMLVAASCSASGGFMSTEADELTATWFGYLNPGQIATPGDVENYRKQFGEYPILTAEQSRHLNVL